MRLDVHFNDLLSQEVWFKKGVTMKGITIPWWILEGQWGSPETCMRSTY